MPTHSNAEAAVSDAANDAAGEDDAEAGYAPAMNSVRVLETVGRKYWPQLT